MVEVLVNNQDSFLVEREGDQYSINGQKKEIDIRLEGKDSFQVIYQGKSYSVYIENREAGGKEMSMKVGGRSIPVVLKTELDRLLKELGLESAAGQKAKNVNAPMPGLIHSVKVAVGDTVEKGDALLILEAMKMENVIKAPAAGTVAKVSAIQGDSVEKGALLIAFE